MIGFYNYTVVLTYIGTFFGFLGITYIWSDNLKASLICLMIAGFCDMFDGKVASTMKRTKNEKRFGVQIDSLSDLICFGVLPSLIGYYCSDRTILHIIISCAYLLCALIRLAWFNVDEENHQEKESGSREIYLGLPVTLAALLFPFFIGLSMILDLSIGKVTPWLLIFTAIAFISPFQLKKPIAAGKAAILVFGTITLAIIMIGVIL